MRMLPGRTAGLSCLSSPAWPSKGTVSIKISAAAQAAAFSMPEIWACGPAFSFILEAASCARCALRDPRMIVSPARAQRRAIPVPAGPVPPRMAMGREESGKFRLQGFFGGELIERQLDVDLRISCVALGRDA